MGFSSVGGGNGDEFDAPRSRGLVAQKKIDVGGHWKKLNEDLRIKGYARKIRLGRILGRMGGWERWDFAYNTHCVCLNPFHLVVVYSPYLYGKHLAWSFIFIAVHGSWGI